MALLDPEKIRVIGFDLDNTLYPVIPEMQSRIRGKIYEKLASGLSISVEQAGDLFETNYNGNFPWSQSGSRTVEELAKKYKRKLNGKELVQQSNEEADILDFIQPNPELQEILSRLYSRFQLDILSSSRFDLAIKKLKRIEIDRRLFGHILAGKMFGRKTDGTLYELWLNIRRDNGPKLYIGDSKKQDIDIPKSLGIRTCIVGKEYENADFYIPTINDLERLLFT